MYWIGAGSGLFFLEVIGLVNVYFGIAVVTATVYVILFAIVILYKPPLSFASHTRLWHLGGGGGIAMTTFTYFISHLTPDTKREVF